MASQPSRNTTDHLSDLGFGSEALQRSTQRLLNRDGSFNVSRGGLSFWESVHLYRTMLRMSWWRFVLLLFGTFIGINLMFAILYTLTGPGALTGPALLGLTERLLASFFFSVHTMTTVGFGHIAPQNLMADVLVTVEAFVGLSGFALVAGIIFARFEAPQAKILFSNKAVVGAHSDGRAFKLRIANGGQSELLGVEVRVLLCMTETVDDVRTRLFRELLLDRRLAPFFPLDWTVAHAITADSPLHGMTEEELGKQDAEFLVLVNAIDDTSSEPVHARSSYKWQEVMWDAQFSDMYRTTKDGRVRVDLRRLHDVEQDVVRRQRQTIWQF